MRPTPTPSPPSRRQRLLRRTRAVLALGLVAAASFGLALYLRSRPTAYRPDEKPDDIKNSLALALPPDAPRPQLTDVTRESGLAGFRNFAGPRSSQLPEDMGPGLAWGDFDNDGDDDLFLVAAGAALGAAAPDLPASELYRNLGHGTFEKVAAFPETRLRGCGAAWGDYDGDGFLDLVVAGYNALQLFHNEGGTGVFKADPRIPSSPGFWTSVAWGDFDQDRRLDLYACQYVRYVEDPSNRARISDQIGTAVPFTLNPASYEPGLNALFHQNPDGSFADVAAQLGVQNPAGRSLGAIWHDLDADGRLDLYVANDLSDNVLFHNVGGRFEDLSHSAWVADYRSAMGLAIGDFDRDGDDDLHITHWVAQENALYQSQWSDLNPMPADGVKFSPKHPLRFIDVADQQGLGQIALPYVGWGTEFADLDQDGWLDLLVANGSTLENDSASPRRLEPQESFLFWNQQGRHFHNLAPLAPALASPHVSRGLAVTDVDGDGDLDFAIADLGEGVRLLRNDMAKGHWLKVRLKSLNTESKPVGFGDGSTAIVTIQGARLRRTVDSVSYLSQSSHTLHWGLGGATRVDRLQILWQAGNVQQFENLEVDATYDVFENGTLTKHPNELAASAAISPATSTMPPRSDRERTKEFWIKQRAAMDALKARQDFDEASRLFREALALNPDHEDSRYYLGHCLASLGQPEAALAELDELRRRNPASHRAWQQWGSLRAAFARTQVDLLDAERSVDHARQLNPEETGALLLLAEIQLLLGHPDLAEARLIEAVRTNPKAVGGFFLLGYVAWKRGQNTRAAEYLAQTRTALGPDWTPKGTTSEGDARRRQFVESTPLTRFWTEWSGAADPAAAFARLDARLTPHPDR
ncbi:MAG: VCBS repeat-containing protein [Verrucomicrobiales bacterium]|nr:VCBS repeat-containing protein [Verrucomicrobiales bacterium]